MAIVINVEDFCILKSKVGGHRTQVCPQCKALKAIAIEVNNSTIDMIADRLQAVADKENAVLDPKKAVAGVLGLKIDMSFFT
jgi:hypothetical protein